MNSLFDRLKSQLREGFPFAVYCKPGSDLVTGIFQNEASAHYLTDFGAKGFVFAPFLGRQKPFIPAEASDIITAAVTLNGFAPAEPMPAPIDPSAKDDFEQLVRTCITAIKEGQFEKLVPSRTEVTTLRDTDVAGIYQKLLYTYPNAFRYCFYHPNAGLWMGATPEQLLKAESRTVHTVALAGTQVYREGEEAQWGTKEQEEQQFVTHYILESLGAFADDIQATPPYTHRAGNLVHIKTDISAELKDAASLQDVVEALHPTPAVCGLPKKTAGEFLLANEGYDREFYSGYLGELNMDFATGKPATDLFVNLRCMKVAGETAQLFIGCGVTRDSDPESEFLETVNKSMTMRRVL